MADQKYTLPEELLREISKQLDDEYTLEELDDSAMWACAGPVAAAASVGLAVNGDHTIYYAAGVYAGSIMIDYIQAGLIDPKAISHYINVTIPEAMAAEDVQSG